MDSHSIPRGGTDHRCSFTHHVSITSMSPRECKNGYETLDIQCSFEDTPFGSMLIAATSRGICHISFADDKTLSRSHVTAAFPHANFSHKKTELHTRAGQMITDIATAQAQTSSVKKLPLHLCGTSFQLDVWHHLQFIPIGGVSTYGAIAATLGRPNACRAVGNAVGRNPISIIIPCHRVIRSTGELGGYMWGSDRKKSILAREAQAVARQNEKTDC